MDFAFTPEEQRFRSEVREFLKSRPPPERKWVRPYFDFYSHYQEIGAFTRQLSRELGAKGWLSLTWPADYGGRNASPMSQLILIEELEYNRCPGIDIFGATMIAPTLIRLASEEQKRELLPGIGKGEAFWCECLSEPGAGSDLASLQTQATDSGDHFVISGQKVWTSGAHEADWCLLLARTNRELAKHRGLSAFAVDMKAQGISVRPLVNMAGDHEFNEVFFDGVQVPKRNLVGERDRGWQVVMTLLNFERPAIPFYAIARRYLGDLVEYALQTGNVDPAVRGRMAELSVECEVGRLLAYHVAWLQEKGHSTECEAAMVKVHNVELNQRVAAVGAELAGLYVGLTEGSRRAPLGGAVSWNYLRSVGNTLEMGTSEIDRDIIARRGLGLPSA